MLTIKCTSVQDMHVVWVCVCVFIKKLLQFIYKKRIYETCCLSDESFKVNFQVKLPNGSRLQPTRLHPIPSDKYKTAAKFNMPLLEYRCLLHNSRLCAANPQDVLNFWISAQQPCWSLILVNRALTCGQDLQRIHFLKGKRTKGKKKAQSNMLRHVLCSNNFEMQEKLLNKYI